MNSITRNLGKILRQISKYNLPSDLNTCRHFAVFSNRSSTLLLQDVLTSKEQCITSTDLIKNVTIFTSQVRFKSYSSIRKGKSKSSEHESGSDSESDNDPIQEPKELQHGSKVVQIQTDSLRCDLILKNGLGISRNKLEMYFYEGRIRVNGRKIMKKSTNVSLGDEVDLVKKFDDENSEMLNIGRVEILNAKPSGDFILLTVRKFKNLLIENYDEHPWEEKQPEESTQNEDDENSEDKRK